MATIRPRSAKEPFEIHHDELEEESTYDEHGSFDSDVGDSVATKPWETEQKDWDQDSSSDLDEPIDSSVLQDMDKFEASFKDIKDRFRLINRIGEGKLVPVHFWGRY
jgi:cell division control protein 7